ncbi:MAG: glutamyl-tRNA reductase [Oligoflexales bacterium]
MNHHIHCAGLSHRTTPIDIREKAYFPEQELKEVLLVLQKECGLEEVAILSTCNRFEMYAVADSPETVKKAWEKLLENKVSFKLIQPHTYYYENISAIHHIFSVASSLDSLVIGETQITGQFKQAIALAEATGTCGHRLGRLTQEALSTAKKVRSKTVIGQKTVSIGHTAVDLARRVYGVFQEHRLLLIGAGHMSRTTAHYALRHHPQDLYIANRTKQSAIDLVENLGVGQAHDLKDLKDLLCKADVIISCTGASEFILRKEDLAPIMRKRGGKPLIIVDIAVPKDIDPRCRDFEEVYLFDVDDLQQVVDKNLDERRIAAEQARSFIEAATTRFSDWLQTRALKPAIAEFREYLENIIHTETQKTLSKQVMTELNPQVSHMIEKMQKSIGQKIIADVAQSLANPDHDYRRDHLTSALQTLFQNPKKDSNQ